MKAIIVLLLLLPVLALAQVDTGPLYSSWEIPTSTEGGASVDPADIWGYLLTVESVDTGDVQSVFINDPQITAHTFGDLPVGQYQYKSVAYDSLGCAGLYGEVRTIQVKPVADPLSALVSSLATGGDDATDPEQDCADDPNCEVVGN